VFLSSAGESDGTSGSDFSDTRRKRLAQRQKRANHGRDADADTDDEDQRDDEDLEEEAVVESAIQQGSKKGKKAMHPRPSKKAIDRAAASEESTDEELDDVQVPVEDWKKVSGPLPKAAKVATARLARAVNEGAAKIARKYGKSVRQIMLQAGLAVRPSRGPNIANIYKTWYAHEHPIEPGGE
jgi:hypothetical protein